MSEATTTTDELDDYLVLKVPVAGVKLTPSYIKGLSQLAADAVENWAKNEIKEGRIQQ